MNNLELLNQYQCERIDTLNDLKKVRKEIDDLDNTINNTKLSTDDKLALIKASGDYKKWRVENLEPLLNLRIEYYSKEEKLETIRKMQNINEMLALGSYCKEKIILSGIFEKYLNKSLGDKTKKKLEDELENLFKPLKLRCYICKKSYYDWQLSISYNKLPLYSCGINLYYLFKLESNKIIYVEKDINQIVIRSDRDYYLPKTYYSNYEQTINKKKELRKDIESSFKNLKELIEQYNNTGINTNTYLDYIKWENL